VVYGTNTLGMTGMPEHAKNTCPQTSKSSHLIYYEILHVFSEVLHGLLHGALA
jgi:hypothetical protein